MGIRRTSRNVEGASRWLRRGYRLRAMRITLPNEYRLTAKVDNRDCPHHRPLPYRRNTRHPDRQPLYHKDRPLPTS